MLELQLHELPEDPLTLIFSFLPLLDVVNLSATSKRLRRVSNRSTCWQNAALSLFDSASLNYLKREVNSFHDGDFKQFCKKKVCHKLQFEKSDFKEIIKNSRTVHAPPRKSWGRSAQVSFVKNGCLAWARSSWFTDSSLSSVRIPGLVNIIGHVNEEEIWLIKEFCLYGDLKRIMKKNQKPLNEVQIATVAKEALIAIKALDECDSVSFSQIQSMRASKIYLNEQLETKFDLHMEINAVYDIKSTQTHWIAPEAITMDEITHKSQIWSLGITCIELAEGEVPNSDKSAMAMMFTVVKGNPPSLKKPENYFPEFVDFISKCLIVKQEARISVDELLQHEFLQLADKNSLRTLIPNK